MSLDPEKVVLTELSKQFEYEKIAREIDECDDLEQLRNLGKCFLKLYMKQQETASHIIKGQL